MQQTSAFSSFLLLYPVDIVTLTQNMNSYAVDFSLSCETNLLGVSGVYTDQLIDVVLVWHVIDVEVNDPDP